MLAGSWVHKTRMGLHGPFVSYGGITFETTEPTASLSVMSRHRTHNRLPAGDVAPPPPPAVPRRCDLRRGYPCF